MNANSLSQCSQTEGHFRKNTHKVVGTLSATKFVQFHKRRQVWLQIFPKTALAHFWTLVSVWLDVFWNAHNWEKNLKETAHFKILHNSKDMAQQFRIMRTALCCVCYWWSFAQLCHGQYKPKHSVQKFTKELSPTNCAKPPGQLNHSQLFWAAVCFDVVQNWNKRHWN